MKDRTSILRGGRNSVEVAVFWGLASGKGGGVLGIGEM